MFIVSFIIFFITSALWILNLWYCKLLWRSCGAVVVCCNSGCGSNLIGKYVYLSKINKSAFSRQRKLSVKTLRYPLFAEFWSNCVLSGRSQTPRFIPIPEWINGNTNLNKYYSFISFISPSGIEPTTNRFYNHTFRPCARTGLMYSYNSPKFILR